MVFSSNTTRRGLVRSCRCGTWARTRSRCLALSPRNPPKLESKDELKRRIDEASKYVPLERLALSPQCGFASTIEGNPLTEEDEKRKLRLVVETAREVWGF